LDYITAFLERDIPNLGIRIAPETLRRFWQMISFYHGGIVNFSELGQSFGVADTTIRHYLDILKGTFMVRLLFPWYINIGKRLIKRPKIYIRDSGIFHTLLSIKSENALHSHPKLGASWEGFALECVLRSIKKTSEEVYFWGTHGGAEVDLFWQHEGKNYGCEFKYSDAPKFTKSIKSAFESIELEKLWVIYPGRKKYFILEKAVVLPIEKVESDWNYELE
jgi:predicted AAA+ superfamily ATPase